MPDPKHRLVERFRPTSDFTVDFQSDALRRLHEYWKSKLAGRPMPRRADIDPTEIPSLLPHIALVGIEHEPLRLRFRLIGTHITDVLGRDSTGRYFDDIYQGRMLEDMVGLYRTVLQSKTPVRHFGKALYADKEHRDYESVHLPLSEDGRTVNIVLAGLQFFF